MKLDPDQIRFHGKAITIAMHYGGSLDGSDASTYVDKLYSEWKSNDLSFGQVEIWLKDRLSDVFKSLDAPPVWVEEEPAWPFISDKPMVFLNQCSMPDNTLSNQELSPGETVYLFGGRKTESGITTMAYKTVSQFRLGY